MNEQQSQNLLLKVDLLSTICNNKFIMQSVKLKTSAKLRVFYLCIEYIVTVFKVPIYGVPVFVSRISPPLEQHVQHFFVAHVGWTTSLLCDIPKNGCVGD